jgi:hypothetical protein
MGLMERGSAILAIRQSCLLSQIFIKSEYQTKKLPVP